MHIGCLYTVYFAYSRRAMSRALQPAALQCQRDMLRYTGAVWRRTEGAIVGKRGLILAVDDEPDILRVLELALTDEGYDVLRVQRSPEAVPLVRERHPSLVLLDLMMPEMDGMEVLRRIRQFSPVPVIILTARGSDRDIIAGLDAGADDYLQKPFNLNELSARIRAVLRRSKPDTADTLGKLVYENLAIDFVRRRVDVNGRMLVLTRNEWRLLEQLARHPGRILTHEELLTRAWGPEFAHDSDYLRVWVSRLRKKLAAAGADPNIIRTASGIGYAFALSQQEGVESNAY
jgi:two-component system KDP operon response regulator KdpE